MSLTRYAPLRRSPPESIAAPRAAPRLACVRPAASVHPEPGSNSSLYNNYFIFPVAPVLLSPVRSPGRNRRSYFFRYFLLSSSSLFNELSLSVFPAPLSLSRAPRSERDCKGTAFFFISNFFSNFFLIFLPIFLLNTLKILIATRIRRMKNFRFF